MSRKPTKLRACGHPVSSRKRPKSSSRALASKTASDDHFRIARKADNTLSSGAATIADVDDHGFIVACDQSQCISTSASNSADDDRSIRANHGQPQFISSADLKKRIGVIHAHWRNAVFARKQRIRIGNTLSAFLRTQLGWSLDKSEKEREKIAKQAAKMIADGGGEWAEFVVSTEISMAPWQDIESRHIKAMEKIAIEFPVWCDFGKPVRGFGLASFAKIVAMAGDLSQYPTVGHLQKRLGISVVDGVRQGNPGKGATADDWIRHGYKRTNRAEIWQIGASLIKAQVRAQKDADGKKCGDSLAVGRYGAIYLGRKKHELARGLTLKHADNRAKRYMEKCLIRDLWAAWRQVMSLGALVDQNASVEQTSVNLSPKAHPITDFYDHGERIRKDHGLLCASYPNG